MGCTVEKTDTGVEIDVHVFDTKLAATHYLMVGRRYKYERHETWGFTSGIDFYQGPNPEERASLREKTSSHFGNPCKKTIWSVAFWIDKTKIKE